MFFISVTVIGPGTKRLHGILHCVVDEEYLQSACRIVVEANQLLHLVLLAMDRVVKTMFCTVGNGFSCLGELSCTVDERVQRLGECAGIKDACIENIF